MECLSSTYLWAKADTGAAFENMFRPNWKTVRWSGFDCNCFFEIQKFWVTELFQDDCWMLKTLIYSTIQSRCCWRQKSLTIDSLDASSVLVPPLPYLTLVLKYLLQWSLHSQSFHWLGGSHSLTKSLLYCLVKVRFHSSLSRPSSFFAKSNTLHLVLFYVVGLLLQ